MHDAIDRQRQAQRGDGAAAFIRADGAFHQAIARSVDCEYAWRVLEAPEMQLDRVRYLAMPFATPVETIIKQHQARLPAAGVWRAD